MFCSFASVKISLFHRQFFPRCTGIDSVIYGAAKNNFFPFSDGSEIQGKNMNPPISFSAEKKQTLEQIDRRMEEDLMSRAEREN